MDTLRGLRRRAQPAGTPFAESSVCRSFPSVQINGDGEIHLSCAPLPSPGVLLQARAQQRDFLLRHSP